MKPVGRPRQHPTQVDFDLPNGNLLTVDAYVAEWINSVWNGGYRAGLERAAQMCETLYPNTAKWASENADYYHTQDETRHRCAAAIRKLMSEE